ncbi:unnamed protein product [Pylaiella littoralis]
MADLWQAAVAGGDAAKLSELVLSAADFKPESALSVLKTCVALLEKKMSLPISEATFATPSGAPADSSTTPTPTPSSSSSSSSGGAPALLSLENVQLLQPRGRFNLVFRKGGVTITGKAGAVVVPWDNVRHIIRLPRPEGFNWGKNLDPDDPAGSDLVALPLTEPLPFRKSKTSLVLLQPDPKAKHAEVSITLDDGVSHQVSGSQGTVVMWALKLLSGVRQSAPDRGLFASRDGKSFVKCYHGVNEGSLFPLKEGLLFMKPALFLPRSNIEEVVCGRGGSATTRYVDLVVGLEVEDGEGSAVTVSQQEFSNIDRDALPSLQSYIQDALVAPRQREVKKAAKAEAKAEAAAEQQQQRSPPAAPPAAARTAATPAVPAAGGERSGGGSGSAVTVAKASSAKKRAVDEEEEEEDDDDGDAESDEDFAPVAGDTDSDDDSGVDVGSDDTDGRGGDDDDDDDDAAAAAAAAAAKRAEVLRELDELANEAAGGGGSSSGGGGGGGGATSTDLSASLGGGAARRGTPAGSKKRKLGGTGGAQDAKSVPVDQNNDDDTESDGEASRAKVPESHAKKRQR